MENEGERQAIDAFHDLYYGKQTWTDTHWLGTAVEKCPLDLWIYQELLTELRPDLIVETGTRYGGSALFMASMCDLLDNGRIITLDIEERDRPAHPRITYVSGHSSTALEAASEVRRAAEGAETVMVVLDSDHSKYHVLNELEVYSPFVTVGSYLIVEDTNINGHPVAVDFGPGPMEALERFLEENDDFEIDDAREKFLLTFNPRGYLKRVR